MAEPDQNRDPEPKISNGPNARPRDEPIAQTAHGLPDDTGHPVEIAPEEEARIARKILDE